MKSPHPIRIYLGLLATLAAASSIDAGASGIPAATADLDMRRHAVVATAAYDDPARVSRTVYTVSAVNQPPVQHRAASVSEHEVDGWKLLAAVIGLVGIRLWHAGKKILPLIG